MTFERKVIIVGAGGHCRSVIDCLRSSGRTIDGILDLEYKGQKETILDIPVIGSYRECVCSFDSNVTDMVLAVGDNVKRETIFNHLTRLGYRLPCVVHDTAIISRSSVLNDGCFIGPGCVINVMASVGCNTIVNTGAIIDHETTIGSHCHVGPGTRIAGRVTIGARSFIGIGASIADNIVVGENVVVGAGSVILKDIESNSTVVGVPGRRIR